MKLHTDLVVDAATRERRGRLWLALGVAALAVGLAAQFAVRQRAAERDELARQAEATLLLRAKDSHTDEAEARQRRGDAARNEYRRTFPLNDVLSALEAMRDVHVRSVVIAVDEGLVRLELGASRPEALATASASLERSLAEWDVRLLRESRDDRRLVASIEMRDRLRSRAWTDPSRN